MTDGTEKPPPRSSQMLRPKKKSPLTIVGFLDRTYLQQYNRYPDMVVDSFRGDVPCMCFAVVWHFVADGGWVLHSGRVVSLPGGPCCGASSLQVA